MWSTFRAKLLWIAGTAAFALLLVVTGSALIAERQSSQLADVERRLVPKLELGPRLQARFDALARGMQEAVAAEDLAALDATVTVRNDLFQLITRSSASYLSSAEAASLRWAIQDYYETARDVSRKLIERQTGEGLLRDVATMQKAHARAKVTLEKTTELGPTELSDAFAAVSAAAESADRFRVTIGVASWLLVAILSFWVVRGLLRVLADLSSGFARFATGSFDLPIPISGSDELAKVAGDANQMAESLRRLAEQRDRHDWLAAGRTGLSSEIHGETEPAAVAERGLAFLARRIDARAGVLYVADEEGVFQRAAQYALAPAEAADAKGERSQPAPGFARGQGLVGQAALHDEIMVVEHPPAGYLTVRSGLGEASPTSIVLVPLFHLGKAVAILELALFTPCSEAVRALLGSVREALVVALEVARSRSVLKRLLDQTQAQAERLMSQEEELRMSNRELEAQQEELRQTNEELESQRVVLATKNVELEDARSRTQEKAEELAQVSSYKSQFLANMSHELRTPLNSMLLLSHLLGANEAGNLSPKQVEYAKTIHGAGQDLLNLINQVLDLSKIEAGKHDVDIEPVALPHFLTHANRVFGPLAADKGLELVTEIDAETPEVIHTDRLLVERILTNLLGNAIKFTERGSVRLRIGRPGPKLRLRPGLSRESSVVFAVSDTGIGIAADQQERVFSPFEQLDSRSDRRYTGTGLGLAIVRQSAELLGGDIQLESTKGSGSTFTLHLPERPSSSPAAGAERRRATLTEHGVTDDRDQLGVDEPYVLIIEDDLVLAEQLVDIVRARGVKVIAADSGLYGLQLAAERRPQGILLDVKLPDIDGWTVMQRLRENPATRSIPVHFLSGIDAPERGLSLGAIGYLTKPATHSELAGAVRALTPPSSDGASRVLVVEDSAAEGGSLMTLLAHEGLDALLVTSAGAALSALGGERFGCMILDLGLPDMDGLGFLETLRERHDVGRPRVVVHTARALTKRETRQLEAYAEAVILKDGRSEERLLEEIRLFVRHLRDGVTGRPQAREMVASQELSLKGAKVLLADDDMRTVYALSALLVGKGADVLVADTGREALDLLAKHTGVDAVLMDLMMPEMDGYQAMRELRTNPSFAELPVIALTAKAMKGERERCLEAGASDYLTKPVDGAQLLSTLANWLKSGSNGS